MLPYIMRAFSAVHTAHRQAAYIYIMQIKYDVRAYYVHVGRFVDKSPPTAQIKSASIHVLIIYLFARINTGEIVVCVCVWVCVF